MLLYACGERRSPCTAGGGLGFGALSASEWVDRAEEDVAGAFVATLFTCPLKIESSSLGAFGLALEKISRRVTAGVAVLYACSAFCSSLSRIGFHGIAVKIIHYPASHCKYSQGISQHDRQKQTLP